MSQESQLTNLAEIVSEMMKRIDDQELRNKTLQTQNGLEVQALKRRIEDLQNHAIKDAKTIREEYDTAVDSLGNLMEDMARRVTKAVQHHEERFNSDIEKLREHVGQALNTHSMALTQKIESALVGISTCHQEAESEDTAAKETASNMPRNDVMRRTESMAHMLRAEALAQSQAFEAKLASVEATHGADTKRLQGMLQSSHVQLQSLQRSMTAFENGHAPKPHSPRTSHANLPAMGSARALREKEAESTLREELTSKLRNIQSSVTGVLTVLDSSGPTRGQSPVAKPHTRSPVQLPINPVGTLEKQRQKDFEMRITATTLNTPKVEPRLPQRAVVTTGATHPGLMSNSPNMSTCGSRTSVPMNVKNASAWVAPSLSQQQIPQTVAGMSRLLSGVYPVQPSGMGSPRVPVGPMAAAPQAINLAPYPNRTKVRGI